MAFPSDSARTKNWGTEVLTDSDLEAQLDLLHNYFLACLNSSTGHSHDGTSNQGPKINITNLTVSSQALGDLIYASSGSAWARKGGNTTTTKKFLNQTGDGSASAAPSWDALVSTDLPAGSVLQMVQSIVTASSTGTTTIPLDDTIPQNTEGDQVTTVSITPKYTTSRLVIRGWCHYANDTSAATREVLALFQDSTAGALAAGVKSRTSGENDLIQCVRVEHEMAAGTTSSTTFKIRVGASSASTTRINGEGASRILGGVLNSGIIVYEVKA